MGQGVGVKLSARQAAKARRLAERLGQTGLVLPGTVTERYSRCGRPDCRCHADPPRLHGPYWSWTRKVDKKTVTRLLTPEQLEDYQPLFENLRTARRLLAELEALSLEVVDSDPRWKR